MTNMQQAQERWKQVEELFHEALELRQEQRKAFLESACKGDKALEREVISLLENHSPEQPLIPNIDMEEARQAVAGNRPRYSEGDKLDSYQIIRLLGSGGMGEVYLARDPRLGRKVAIKILTSLYSKDPNFLKRLQSEAQTASALNHPNILTIFAFGQTDGSHYIVSEYVEGTQLRELIGKLDQATAIKYATQIAQALDAAHSVGIIHRDIKPENIMVRPDGYLKVLDFGLAKYIGNVPDAMASLHERLNVAIQGTTPGLLMGTISYMSPEQLRGQTVDAHTDIWSWGVVFYEMLAGKRPFEAETTSDVMVRILEGNPPSPVNDKKINSVLACALAKKPDDRYEKIHQAVDDLMQLRARNATTRIRVLQFPHKNPPALTPPSRKAIIGQWLLWTVLVMMLTLSGVGVFRLYEQMREKPYHIDSITRLTTLGDVTYAAISADGNYVAYVVGDPSRPALHLLQLGTNADSERLPATEGHYTGITFSPDGKFIYYVLNKNEIGTLYRIPMLAGPPYPIISDVDSAIAFSPDGQKFVFERFDPRAGHDSIFLRSVEDGEEQAIATVYAPKYLLSAPAFAPDGKSVVFGIYNDAASTMQKISFAGVRIRDHQIQYGSPLAWTYINKPVMISNSQIIVGAQDMKSIQRQLFEVNWRTGEFHPLTLGGWYSDLTLSSNQKSIVTTQRDRISNVWLISPNEPDSPRRLTRSGGRFYEISWADRDNIIAQADSNGLSNLQIEVHSQKVQNFIEGSGKDLTPITNAKTQYLIFVSNRDGSYHLWRSQKDGSHSSRLTTGNFLETTPSLSRDGKTVVFTSSRNGQMGLWKVPIEGGDPVNIAQRPAQHPDISPDGKLIVCEYSAPNRQGWEVTVLDSESGKVVEAFPNIPFDVPVRWSPSGNSLLYVVTGNGVSNIWEQQIHGGSAHQLTHFREERIYSFAVSPEDNSIAVLRGNNLVDAVLIQGIRQ